MTSNDLLVAFALACPFAAVWILCAGDVARWLRGKSGDEVGAGRVDRPGAVTSYGLTADTASADDWFGDAVSQSPGGNWPLGGGETAWV